MPAIGEAFSGDSVHLVVDNLYIADERSLSFGESRDTNETHGKQSLGSVTFIGGKKADTVEIEGVYIDDISGLTSLISSHREGNSVTLKRLEPRGTAFGSLSNPTEVETATAFCTSLSYSFESNTVATLSASFAVSGVWS